MEVVGKPVARAKVERPLVQILVVVANIQMRTLKTEVEKGSMSPAIVHGLVDPKRYPNGVYKVRSGDVARKGTGLTFPDRDVDSERRR